MTIVGLNDDYYCVHVPIPVSVFPDSGPYENPYFEFRLKINGVDLLEPFPILYSRENTANLDLAPWVKLGMEKFQDLTPYTSTLVTHENPYMTTMEMTFTLRDSSNVMGEVETITKTFVHCAIPQGLYIADQREFIKVWKGFPISWQSGDDRLKIIPNVSPSIAGKYVEFDQSKCTGTYIKWLNEYGNYNYWLFPHSRQFVRSGEEYYRTPINIFNSDERPLTEKTVGFEVKEMMTVKDIVNKKFWSTIKSIVGSPEVYMLVNNDPNQVNPTDWLRIIQSDVKFDRTEISRNSSEVEFEFELPKVPTQTRL